MSAPAPTMVTCSRCRKDEVHRCEGTADQFLGNGIMALGSATSMLRETEMPLWLVRAEAEAAAL